ncbi:MAG TPA: hypothetical protein VFD46_13330 [Chryseolinea sp.]|nr:hypothetical protein [Chryseolinea sp.]
MKKLFSNTIQNFTVITMTKKFVFALTAMILCVVYGYAQDPKKEWTGDGEIENVEIEIIKEREITLPPANRNFEKIPPRPAEAIKPPITYDFQSFSFQAPQSNPLIRPLKLKQENPSHVYGGFLRVGYGNYTSPLLEAYYNTRRDKNKLIGAHLLHASADKGPVDGRNSGSGSTGLSVFGRSFTKGISLSGNAGFENRSTHFYGYPAGTQVEASDIKQSFNLLKIAGALSNAKNSDFSYKLGAGVSHLADKFDARETEIDLEFSSAYEISEETKINLKGDYFYINRKDTNVEKHGRSLFILSPSVSFMPLEDLKVSVGFKTAFENDTIDSKSVHVYPDIKASYPISPTVDAVASLSGGIEKVSLQSLSYDNMWLAPDVPIFHTNKTIDFNVGLNAKLGNKISAHSGLAVANLKNWYYFVNTAADQSKFTVLYDGGSGTKRANLYAAVSYLQSEIAKFMLRADLYRYSTARLDEPWHRPTYRVTANAFYNLYDKLLFNVDVIAQGGMKAFEPVTDTTVKLDAAFDLNFKTEYLFSQSFSAFIQLNNIASSKYPVFLNYPVRGFQLLGGVTWSF